MTSLGALCFYLTTGCLIALGVGLNGVVPVGKRTVASVFIIFLWPAAVLIAPEAIFGPRSEVSRNRSASEHSSTPQRFPDIALASEGLSDQETRQVALTMARGPNGLSFLDPFDAQQALELFWVAGVPPESYYAVARARADLHRPDEAAARLEGRASRDRFDEIVASQRAPDWSIAYSKEFLKAIASIDPESAALLGGSEQESANFSEFDASLRLSIMRAIGKVMEDPHRVVSGLTKPMSENDPNGLWQYRIGKHRMLYLVEAVKGRITLVSFAEHSRGERPLASSGDSA